VSGITGADLKRRIVQIMSRHFEQKLSFGKKAILATAGLVAIAGPVAFGLIQMIPMHVQILHATGRLPSYEVATIKPEGEADDHLTGRAGDVMSFNGTTKDLIEGAFNVPHGAGERVIGGPSWITTNRYVIDGKVPDDLFTRMQTMSGTDRRTQNALMKQSLLADRFKLKAHFEMREMPVYELVLAKGGAKVKLATPDPNAPSVPRSAYYMNTFGPHSGLGVTRGAQGVLEMKAKNMAMDKVAESFEEAVKDLGGRTIVDRTGLNAQYDFTLKWTPQLTASAPAANADSAGADSDAPSIFTALEEQLGLKLVPAKGMVEVVVIDSIERPSAN
jgi:uncharacterized protein (TIGR03435 family)